MGNKRLPGESRRYKAPATPLQPPRLIGAQNWSKWDPGGADLPTWGGDLCCRTHGSGGTSTATSPVQLYLREFPEDRLNGDHDLNIHVRNAWRRDVI